MLSKGYLGRIFTSALLRICGLGFDLLPCLRRDSSGTVFLCVCAGFLPHEGSNRFTIILRPKNGAHKIPYAHLTPRWQTQTIGEPSWGRNPVQNTISQNYHGGKSKPRPHVRNNALVNILPKQPLESTNKPVRTVQIQEQVDKTTVIPVVP